MAKLYYDHLLVLDEVDDHIRSSTRSTEEREELEYLVDEMVHHRVMGCVLDSLPQEHHSEFLDKFHKAPHDEELLKYLQERIDDDVERIVKAEVAKMKDEILEEIGK